MEKLPWRTPRVYPLAQQPAGRDADGERTSDERTEESPRRTLEAAWGKLEPLPRDSDITSRIGSRPPNRWAAGEPLSTAPYVIRPLAELAVAGGDISGHPDAAGMAYVRQTVERSNRARTLKALESLAPPPSLVAPIVPPALSKAKRVLWALGSERVWQDVGEKRRWRVVRHRDGQKRRIAVQRGDEGPWWHIEAAGPLLYVESLSIPPGSSGAAGLAAIPAGESPANRGVQSLRPIRWKPGSKSPRGPSASV
jgi:hypothetical protein